jgi:hypothetical protein
MGIDRTEPTQPAQPAEAAQVIGQLSKMIDLVEYQDVIGRKTRYGKRPGPDPWHYTRQLLSTYTDPPDADDVIQLFKAAGCKDEVAAAKWIVINDELVP